jgi:four helix bundle protein
MKGPSVVQEKSEKFATRIVKMYQYLKDEKHEYILSKQILRSGTSIGANVTEALSGISRKDFLAKMYISLKECRETAYWLKILHEGGYISEREYASIDADCVELGKILSSITKTTAETITPNS